MVGVDSPRSTSTLENNGDSPVQCEISAESTSGSSKEACEKSTCFISRKAVRKVLTSLWYQILCLVVILLDCVLGIIFLSLTRESPQALWYGATVIVFIDINILLDIWVSGREFFYAKVAQPETCCCGTCVFKHWRVTNMSNMLISFFATWITIEMLLSLKPRRGTQQKDEIDDEVIELENLTVFVGRVILLLFRLLIGLLMFRNRIEKLVVTGGEKKGKQVLGRILGDLFKIQQSNILIDPLIGAIKLDKLEFNVEAWEQLHLPFVIKAGFLDSIDVKLPVNSLLQDAIPFIRQPSQTPAQSPETSPRSSRIWLKTNTSSLLSPPPTTSQSQPQTFGKSATLPVPAAADSADARREDGKKKPYEPKKSTAGAANAKNAQQKADQLKVHIKNVLIVLTPHDSTWQWHDVLTSRNKAIQDMVKWARITGVLERFVPASTRATILPRTFVEKQKATFKKLVKGTLLHNVDLRFEAFEFVMEAAPPFVYKPVCFGVGFGLCVARVGEREECEHCIANDLVLVEHEDAESEQNAGRSVKAGLNSHATVSSARSTSNCSDTTRPRLGETMDNLPRSKSSLAGDALNSSSTSNRHTQPGREKLSASAQNGTKPCVSIELEDMMVYGDFTFTSYVTMRPNAVRKYFTHWWTRNQQSLGRSPETTTADMQPKDNALAAKLAAHTFILSPVNILVHLPTQGTTRKGTMHVEGYTNKALAVTFTRDQVVTLRSVKAWHAKWQLLNLSFVTRPQPLKGTESQMDVSLHYRKMWWHAVRLVQLRTRPNNRTYSTWLEMTVVAGLTKQYREVREHEETLVFHRKLDSFKFSEIVAEARLRLPVMDLLFYEAMVLQNTARYINEYRSNVRKRSSEEGFVGGASGALFVDVNDPTARREPAEQVADDEVDLGAQDAMSKDSAVNQLIRSAAIRPAVASYPVQGKEMQLSAVSFVLNCVDASNRTVACVKATLEGELYALPASATTANLRISGVAVESASVTKLYMGDVVARNGESRANSGGRGSEEASRCTLSSVDAIAVVLKRDRWWDGSFKNPNADDDGFMHAESLTQNIFICLTQIVEPDEAGTGLKKTLTVDICFGKMEVVIDDWVDKLKRLFKPAGVRKLALFEQEAPLTKKRKAQPKALTKTQRIVGKVLQVTKPADRAFVTMKFDVVRYVKHQPYSSYRTLIQQVVLAPFDVNIQREFGRSIVMKSTYQEASAHIHVVDTKVVDAIFKDAKLPF